MKHPAIKKVVAVTKGSAFENNVFLVGGAVRDALLNQTPKNDLDIVTELDAQHLAKTLDARAQIYPRFGTALARIENSNVEFVTARKESYTPYSRKPNTQPATLFEDALRRDFTVNALLLNIHNGQILDPLNKGISDLDQKILRTPIDPTKTFHDDPLRMLRAIRLKYQLGFEFASGNAVLDGETTIQDAFFSEAHRLAVISLERIRDEFTKILVGPHPDQALEDLRFYGLLKTWAPELELLAGVNQGKWHYGDVWTHTLHVVQNASNFLRDPATPIEFKNTGINKDQDNVILMLAALLHDIAKPQTRSIDSNGDIRFFQHESIGADMALKLCLRWRYSHAVAKNVQLLVKNHMRLTGQENLSTPAARRIIRDLDGQMNNWLTLLDADANALKAGVRKLEISQIRQKLDAVSKSVPEAKWKSPLTGHEIVEMTQVPPGPLIGELKLALENMVLDGSIPPDDKEKAKDALQILLRNRLNI